jgi:hypothetical protein
MAKHTKTPALESREFESLPGYQNRYISLSFSSQNDINLMESTALSSVTIELVGGTFKLSGFARRVLHDVDERARCSLVASTFLYFA